MKESKKIHVICCNDSVKYAVVDDEEKARLRLIALRDADAEEKGLGSHFVSGRNWHRYKLERYNLTHIWHIQTVEGE